MTEHDVARGVSAPRDDGFDLSVKGLKHALTLGCQVYSLFGTGIFRSIVFEHQGARLTVVEHQGEDTHALTVTDEKRPKIARIGLLTALSKSMRKSKTGVLSGKEA